MTLPVSDNVILAITLGLTRLVADGKLVRLLKWPFCDFRNIHEAALRVHLRWKNDAAHSVDPDKINSKEFYVTKNRKKSRYYQYETKEQYGLPWIKCLGCDYSDCVIRDLEWHFLKEHKSQLYREIGTSRYESIDWILEKAAILAKEKCGIFD